MSYSEIKELQQLARSLRACENEREAITELFSQVPDVLEKHEHEKKDYLLTNIEDYIDGNKMAMHLFSDLVYVLLDIADQLKMEVVKDLVEQPLVPSPSEDEEVSEEEGDPYLNEMLRQQDEKFGKD